MAFKKTHLDHDETVLPESGALHGKGFGCAGISGGEIKISIISGHFFELVVDPIDVEKETVEANIKSIITLCLDYRRLRAYSGNDLVAQKINYPSLNSFGTGLWLFHQMSLQQSSNSWCIFLNYYYEEKRKFN